MKIAVCLFLFVQSEEQGDEPRLKRPRLDMSGEGGEDNSDEEMAGGRLAEGDEEDEDSVSLHH